MKTYSKDELNKILELHAIWTNGDSEGERADLSWADLRGANLSRANLSGAYLCEANLRGANLIRADLYETNLSGADLIRANLTCADLSWADLSGADLTCADLSGARLSWANLSGARLSCADLSWADLRGARLSGTNLSDANLEPIKKDFFKILSQAVNEISFLEKAILEGKIDGSAYEGECACLCGTIEKAGNKSVERNHLRPIERFFLSIEKGDTPENNQFSKIAMEWLQEFKISI